MVSARLCSDLRSHLQAHPLAMRRLHRRRWTGDVGSALLPLRDVFGWCVRMRFGARGVAPHVQPVLQALAATTWPSTTTTSCAVFLPTERSRPWPAETQTAEATAATAYLPAAQLVRLSFLCWYARVLQHDRPGCSCAPAAKLNYPTGVALDGQGGIFIADSGNNAIRQARGPARRQVVLKQWEADPCFNPSLTAGLCRRNHDDVRWERHGHPAEPDLGHRPLLALGHHSLQCWVVR